MKHKYKVLGIGIILVALLSITISYTYSIHFAHAKSGITFKRAFTIASQSAYKWSKNALLAYATSADTEDKKETGNLGERESWNFEFAIPADTNHYVVELRKGNIYSEKQIKGKKLCENELISINDMNVDSDFALTLATKSFNLHPGKDWAVGYHFIIQNQNRIPTICVIAEDNNNMLCKIYYDLKTHQLINAEHQTLLSGSLNIDGKNYPLYDANYWGCCGADIREHRILSWGYYYENKSTLKPFFKESHNDGQTWDNLECSEMIIDAWYFTSGDKTCIGITTNSKIYFLADGNSQAITIFNKNDSIIKSIHNKNVVAAITKDKLYITQDLGTHWNTISLPQDTSDVEIDVNNNIYCYTDHEIFKYKDNSWSLFSKIDSTIQDFISFNNFDIIITKEKLLFTYPDGRSNNIANRYNIAYIFGNKGLNNCNSFYGYDANDKLLKIMKDGDSNVSISEVPTIPGQISYVGIVGQNHVVKCSTTAKSWLKMKGSLK